VLLLDANMNPIPFEVNDGAITVQGVQEPAACLLVGPWLVYLVIRNRKRALVARPRPARADGRGRGQIFHFIRVESPLVPDDFVDKAI
jgi:hypothetical protein